MNSAPQNEQRSPRWTVLPKINSAPQNDQCFPMWTEASLLYHWLPKTNSATQNERNWNVNKIGQKKFVSRYLCWEGILGKKIGLIGHSSP